MQYRTKKRSDRIVMTPAARLLKQLRVERGRSMRKAAEILGLSDSYIAHIETGRLDFPRGEKLNRLLHAYGVKSTAFYERLKTFSASDPRADLTEILDRMRDREIETVLAVARGLVG